MLRLLLIIFFFCSSMAVMAHGVLLYNQATTEALIAEEETTDHKPLLKAAKEMNSEQIGFDLTGISQASSTAELKAMLHKTFHFPTGFCDTPYNPPDQH
jgi:hypothetical protein